jgi:hypothetical protein
MRAYHFLAAHFALGSLALRRSRLSRYEDLNDPFELFAADVREENIRPAVKAMKKHFNQTQGILCFSRTWDNPVISVLETHRCSTRKLLRTLLAAQAERYVLFVGTSRSWYSRLKP